VRLRFALRFLRGHQWSISLCYSVASVVEKVFLGAFFYAVLTKLTKSLSTFCLEFGILFMESHAY
jgi:hypothetical protein